MVKVFGIGCNKTGTTTLGHCLKLLGFGPHAHWPNSNRLVKHWAQGNYQPILEFAENFECFDDSPWNITDVYQHLDIRFPKSKFILTLRDSDSWFTSWCRSNQGDIRLKGGRLWVPYHRKAFGLEEGFSFENLGDQYKKKYQERNQEIQDYFSNRPDDLLVVDWRKGDGWKQLCEFLDKPVPNRPFPRLNKF